MDGLEITVMLGIAVFAGAVLAPRFRIAVPLLLLVFGLALGFVPDLREIELPPETVLLLFLPVMLFWESLTTSLRSIKRDFRGIVIMSTLLVVATAFAVAALGRTLPHRNFMLLKAESLTNDGTALVIYAIAVDIAVGGQYTPLDITGLVLLSYLGGAAAGAATAGAAYLVMRRLRDADQRRTAADPIHRLPARRTGPRLRRTRGRRRRTPRRLPRAADQHRRVTPTDLDD